MDTKALHKISCGLYVVGANSKGVNNAQIANTLVQVCSNPPRVSIVLNKDNLTHDFIVKSKAFSVSILAQDTPLAFIGALGFKSGKDAGKLDGIDWKKGQTGAPVITENALAYLEVKVMLETDVGTHTIFVGDVVESEVLADAEPMTYAYYQNVKRGTTPKTAPSYSEKEMKKEEVSNSMDKYECAVCGYIYDPAQGDSEGGIAAGTPFQKLPADWQCPVCGAGKDEFTKVA